MKCKEVSVELQCGFKKTLPALILQVHNREAVSDREWGFADKMSKASACIRGRELLRFPLPAAPCCFVSVRCSGLTLRSVSLRCGAERGIVPQHKLSQALAWLLEVAAVPRTCQHGAVVCRDGFARL